LSNRTAAGRLQRTTEEVVKQTETHSTPIRSNAVNHKRLPRTSFQPIASLNGLIIENGQKEDNIADAVTARLVSGIKSTSLTLNCHRK